MTPLLDAGKVNISSDAREKWSGPSAPTRYSAVAAVKHLVSSDVRGALRKDPLWRKVDDFARSLVTKLGTRVEGKLRLAIEGPINVLPSENQSVEDADVALVRQQVRTVRHSSTRAARELGYEPLVGFHDSMSAFRRWYRAMYGTDSYEWDLARHLDA